MLEGTMLPIFKNNNNDAWRHILSVYLLFCKNGSRKTGVLNLTQMLLSTCSLIVYCGNNRPEMGCDCLLILHVYSLS